eukprot:scaffold11114_cov44-Phaeocystis_antarctica.AAC.2
MSRQWTGAKSRPLHPHVAAVHARSRCERGAPALAGSYSPVGVVVTAWWRATTQASQSAPSIGTVGPALANHRLFVAGLGQLCCLNRHASEEPAWAPS